jgi:hypothetical protein
MWLGAGQDLWARNITKKYQGGVLPPSMTLLALPDKRIL